MRTLLVVATLLLALASCQAASGYSPLAKAGKEGLLEALQKEVGCHATCVNGYLDSAINLIVPILNSLPPLSFESDEIFGLARIGLFASIKELEITSTPKVTVTKASVIPFPLGIHVEAELELSGAIETGKFEVQYKFCLKPDRCTVDKLCTKPNDFDCPIASFSRAVERLNFDIPIHICTEGTKTTQTLDKLKITLKFSKDLGGKLTSLDLKSTINDISLNLGDDEKICVNGEDKTDRIAKEIGKIKGLINDFDWTPVNKNLMGIINMIMDLEEIPVIPGFPEIPEEIISIINLIKDFLVQKYTECVNPCLELNEWE